MHLVLRLRGRGRNCRLVAISMVTVWLLLWTYNLQQGAQAISEGVGVPDLPHEQNLTTRNSERCSERQNFVYMKVIKCASQTLTNMFRRFGYNRELSFVLPLGKRLYLGWPYTIQQDYYRPSKSGSYNILCDHAVYNKDIMEGMMPTDTVYIASLREPFSQFKSMFHYYNLGGILNITHENPIQEYLTNLDKYEQMYTSQAYSRKRFCIPNGFSMSRNLMSFILGFQTGFLPNTTDMAANETYVNDWLKQLDKDFSLVIIVEYFDESLILLRRMMCWELKDIVYFTHNVGSYAYHEDNNSNLVKLYEEHSRVDVKLYEYFNRTFWQQVTMLGDDFMDEVANFKSILSDISSFCAKISKLARGSIHKVTGTRWNKPFRVDETMCKYLRDDLLSHIKDQYDQTYPDIPQPSTKTKFC